MDRYVQAMVLIRFFSAFAELSGALMMAKLNRLESAVRINALLGLVGPAVLITATAIGLVGLAGKLSAGKILLAICGVFLILVATR